MPRYEYSEGSSNKFWEIDLDRATYTARWGRIGTDGQSQTKTFKSDAEARRAYDKAIDEKVKKGYELVAGEDGEDEESFPSEPSAVNPELEKAIYADPDNVKTRLVYADWLQEQGDPRGELILAQHKKVAKTAEKILAESRARLLGPLAKWEKTSDGENRAAFTWRLGFIHSARFSFEEYANDGEMVDLAEGLRTLLTHPSGRFLEELTFGLNSEEGQSSYSGLLKVLAEKGAPVLKQFFCADFEYPDQIEMSWTHLGDFSKVWAKLPRLEKLIVQGGEFDLGKIELPVLRHAEFRTGGLAKESIKSIATAKWPALEYLDVWFGDDNYGASGGVKDIAPILEGAGLPALKHLGLMNSQFANELARVLPGSKILKQLETLDLSMGVLSDEGLAILLEQKGAFKHLKKIDLSQNFLTAAGVRLAKGLGEAVDAGKQREPYDEESRYVAVGE